MIYEFTDNVSNTTFKFEFEDSGEPICLIVKTSLMGFYFDDKSFEFEGDCLDCVFVQDKVNSVRFYFDVSLGKEFIKMWETEEAKYKEFKKC